MGLAHVQKRISLECHSSASSKVHATHRIPPELFVQHSIVLLLRTSQPLEPMLLRPRYKFRLIDAFCSVLYLNQFRFESFQVRRNWCNQSKLAGILLLDIIWQRV